ncbi:MAG: peptidylprolyl isomerase [Patescibacteria group bacterium]
MNNEIENKKDEVRAKKTGRVAGWAVIIVIALIFIFIAVFALGIYVFSWQDKWTQKVEKIVPYPAALVDYKFLTFNSYNFDLDTLAHYYQEGGVSENAGIATPSAESMEKAVLKRMIRNEITRQLAKEYKVKVTKLESDQELQKIMAQSDDETTAINTLKTLYNWTPEQYRDNVVYYYLLRSKLAEKLSFDDNLPNNIEAKKKADSVLAEVRANPDDFASIAKTSSEDTTSAENGGNLGTIARGQMVSEFEEAAFKLEKGEISDLVRTTYGFHIIKVLNITGEGESQTREVSHILIMTQDIDEYITAQLAKARVYVFKKGLKWDKTTGEAISTAANQQ